MCVLFQIDPFITLEKLNNITSKGLSKIFIYRTFETAESESLSFIQSSALLSYFLRNGQWEAESRSNRTTLRILHGETILSQICFTNYDDVFCISRPIMCIFKLCRLDYTIMCTFLNTMYWNNIVQCSCTINCLVFIV